MLHPSTKRLVDKVGEMTEAGKIGWKQTEPGSCRFETKGYSVEINQSPLRLAILTPDGKTVEEADADTLAATPHDIDGDYAGYARRVYIEADREARGAEKAIKSILEGLDLDGDGIPDVWIESEPETETLDAEQVSDIDDETDVEDPAAEPTYSDDSEIGVASAVENMAAEVNGEASSAPETEEAVVEAEVVADAVPVETTTDASAESSAAEEPAQQSGVNWGQAAAGATIAGGIAAAGYSAFGQSNATVEETAADDVSDEPDFAPDPETDLTAETEFVADTTEETVAEGSDYSEPTPPADDAYGATGTVETEIETTSGWGTDTQVSETIEDVPESPADDVSFTSTDQDHLAEPVVSEPTMDVSDATATPSFSDALETDETADPVSRFETAIEEAADLVRADSETGPDQSVEPDATEADPADLTPESETEQASQSGFMSGVAATAATVATGAASAVSDAAEKVSETVSDIVSEDDSDDGEEQPESDVKPGGRFNPWM